MKNNQNSFLWTFILSRKGTMKHVPSQTVTTNALSFYRMDSTGRVVHYGPGGDVIEDDSAFEVKEVRLEKTAMSLRARKKRTSSTR